MTKAEHKKLIEIVKTGSCASAYYLDIFCGTYTKSWKVSEIKEDVYNNLKERDMLLK